MKKPKRNDLKYLAISFFNDYEFVNCISFEMAIRNKENFQALKDIIAYRYSNFKYKSFLFKVEDNEEISDSLIKQYMDIYNIDNEEEMYRIIEYSNNIKLLENNGIVMKNIDEFFYSNTKEDCLKYFAKTQHFTVEPNKISSSLTTVNVAKYVLLKNDNELSRHNNLAKVILNKQHDKLFKDNDEALKQYGITSLSMNPVSLKEHERIEIGFKYQRPKLHFETNLNALINLNLALPISELTYQLEILKNKLIHLNLHTDINSATSKELAENDYFFDTNEYLKKHNRNETYADLFFTYDYYNYMYPITKRYNKIQNVKRDREIKKIKQRNDLDRYDKTNNIQEVIDNYKRSKLLKPDVLMEIEKQVKLFPVLHSLKKELQDREITDEEFRTEKERIVQEYLYDKLKPSEKPLEYMQKMIDKLQYKEFITGIKNPPKNT